MNSTAYFVVSFDDAKSVAGILADNKILFLHHSLGAFTRFYFENRDELLNAVDTIAELNVAIEVNDE